MCVLFYWAAIAALARRVSGHAYLLEPPARNVLKHQSNDEFCPHCLQAGGPTRVRARGRGIWPTMSDPGSHGLCGDPVQGSAEPTSIADMKYMEASEPQRTYMAGSVVEFSVGISTHHKGHFEFRICDRVLDTSLASAEEGQQCLNARIMQRAPRSESCGDRLSGDCQPLNPVHPERWYLPPPSPGTQVAATEWINSSAESTSPHNEVYIMRYMIPEDLRCEHCTLQWYYATGNTCAYDEDYLKFDPGFPFWAHYGSSWATCSNSCCGDNMWGEEFWNCADVRVSGPSPSSSTSVATHSATTTTATTSKLLAHTTTKKSATTTTTTSSSDSSLGIQSGDAVVLQTHSGSGLMLDVEGTSVQARWAHRGIWQTFSIEKLGGSGGLHAGDIVFLKAHTGKQLDIEGDTVQARWGDMGLWQSLTIEKIGSAGIILPGDVVCLKAHTGKHIDVESTVARARFTDCGHWQKMRIEKRSLDNIVYSGDSVYLMAHTGKHIDVEGNSVQARWSDRGAWQKFTVANQAGGAIHTGDPITLTAHTSKMVEVESEGVQARYIDRGDWQKLIIKKDQPGVIREDDKVSFQAHTGKFVDVDGFAVRARWPEQGLWQSFTIEKDHARLLWGRTPAFPEMERAKTADHTISGTILGIALLTMPALIIALIKNTQFSCRTPSGNKVHPSDVAVLDEFDFH